MAPVSLLICFIFATLHIVLSQRCLTSPSELQWEENDGDFYGTITLDAATFTINDVTFTTRTINQQIPAPTMRMVPGNRYFIKIVNNLGPEREGTINAIKDLNYTTIHTHGLHISGEEPADSVWTVVDPGRSITAIYEPPCFHSGGTFWYHPHHHGSNAVQIGGGAAGALIMDPNEYEVTSFPEWYNALYDSELILVVQWLSLAEVAFLGQEAAIPDELFKTSEDVEFYVINGVYQPTICLRTNIWTKLRISHINIEDTVQLKIIDPDDSCSLYLLSKDGVLIHGIDNSVPREIPSKEIHLTVASRADVAVRCTSPGIYALQAITIDIEEGATEPVIIGNIQVTETKIKNKGNDLLLSDANALTPFHPLRPKYLQSLVFYDGYVNEQTIILDVIVNGDNLRFTLNGEEFQGPTNYVFRTDIRTVQEYTIIEVDEVHPYHQHLNHFQIIENCNDHPDGWSEIGDWIDTVDFSTKIRFITNTFGGGKVIHCHVLRHEDLGMMSVIYIDGGCDGLYQDLNPGAGDKLACDYDRDMCINQGLELWSDYNWEKEAMYYQEASCPVSTSTPTPEDESRSDSGSGSSDGGSSDSSDSSDSSSSDSSSDSGDGMIAFGDDDGMEGNTSDGGIVFTLVVIGFVVGIICLGVGYFLCVRNKKTKYQSMNREDDIDHEDKEKALEMVETVIDDSGDEGDEGNRWMNTGNDQ